MDNAGMKIDKRTSKKSGEKIDSSATSSTTNLTWIARYRPHYRESKKYRTVPSVPSQ